MATRGRVLHLVRVYLSRRAQYAICGIFDLAYNGAGQPVDVRRIGERQRIPHRFLEQIFQRLRRAGIVTGKRGPGGGFVLTRPPGEILLLEVVEAVDGPIRVSSPPERVRAASIGSPERPVVARDRPSGPRNQAVIAHRPDFLWDDLAARMAGVLDGIRVADVCREAVRRSVARDLESRFDYEI